MRITNSMMTSRLLLNIQRNMSYLDTLNNNLESTKRIHVPSDDPILAARALKFRTSVSETEQYQRNVAQGISWMAATDKAFFNVTDGLNKIRELLNQGATGTNILSDRAVIATSIEQIVNQLGKEMNATYAGRYVFSGYRTDQPPVFEANNDNSYNITQRFEGSDVENAKTFVKINDAVYGNVDEGVYTTNVKIIKMAYAGGTSPTVTIGGTAFNPAKMITKSLSTDSDAYNPADDEINFIAETGELVLGKDAYDAVQKGEMVVNYDKKGFLEGDLNPIVYFDCVDYYGVEQPSVFTAANNYHFRLTEGFDQTNVTAGVLQLTYGGITDPVTVTIGNKTYTATANVGIPGVDDVFYDAATGAVTFGANPMAEISALGPGDEFFVSYEKTGFAAGENNPLKNPDILVKDLNDPPVFKRYTMEGQKLEYEFGINTRIDINTLAKNVYTDKLYADLRNFLSFVKNMKISDEGQLRNKIKEELKADPNNAGWTEDQLDTEAARLTTEQLTIETQQSSAALYDRFNNMLGLIDKHFAVVSMQETDLGSRMNRLQLISTRLDGDLVNYKELLSQNEDTDMITTAIEMSVAKAAYEASLKVGANIIQMTLADYIR